MTLDTALQIRIACGQITKLAGRDHERFLAALFPGLTGLQAGVLSILRDRPGTLQSLSALMMLAPATLVPVVDRLEESGWVARAPDPQDRRRNILTLTENGQALAQQVPAVDAGEPLVAVLEGWEPQKRTQLVDLLQELMSELASPETRKIE